MDFQTISINEYNNLLQERQELNQLKEKLSTAESVTTRSLDRMKNVLSGYYEVGMGRHPRPSYVFFPIDEYSIWHDFGLNPSLT